MPGSCFGQIFRISTFGESHGPAIGVVIDGMPAGFDLDESIIQTDLDRRRPGQSSVTTPRKESDKVEILSGVFEGKTTGVPIALLIRNQNQKSKDYSAIKDLYRPGHADFTYEQKYGIRDYRGGGRSSGRETACRVAAGAVAKQYLKSMGVEIVAYTKSVGSIVSERLDFSVIEQNPVRCPDAEKAIEMCQLIEKLRDEGDSVGGVVEAVIKGCPIGIGEPCFDKLNAVLAHALLSIATIKGIEFGLGFEATKMTGFEHNDAFVMKDGQVSTQTNNAGGILGGISSGEDITLRLAVKPPSSISKSQQTVNKQGVAEKIEVHGRHDPCICPRVVPVVESMIAVALLDLILIQNAK